MLLSATRRPSPSTGAISASTCRARALIAPRSERLERKNRIAGGAAAASETRRRRSKPSSRVGIAVFNFPWHPYARRRRAPRPRVVTVSKRRRRSGRWRTPSPSSCRYVAYRPTPRSDARALAGTLLRHRRHPLPQGQGPGARRDPGRGIVPRHHRLRPLRLQGRGRAAASPESHATTDRDPF